MKIYKPNGKIYRINDDIEHIKRFTNATTKKMADNLQKYLCDKYSLDFSRISGTIHTVDITCPQTTMYEAELIRMADFIRVWINTNEANFYTSNVAVIEHEWDGKKERSVVYDETRVRWPDSTTLCLFSLDECFYTYERKERVKQSTLYILDNIKNYVDMKNELAEQIDNLIHICGSAKDIQQHFNTYNNRCRDYT